jgi:hypothetical protein
MRVLGVGRHWWRLKRPCFADRRGTEEHLITAHAEQPLIRRRKRWWRWHAVAEEEEPVW